MKNIFGAVKSPKAIKVPVVVIYTEVCTFFQNLN